MEPRPSCREVGGGTSRSPSLTAPHPYSPTGPGSSGRSSSLMLSFPGWTTDLLMTAVLTGSLVP